MALFFSNNQNGNVLFLILIAIALFASLSFVATSYSRSNEQSGSKETALIASSEIVQFSTALANAVTHLRVSNRCSIRQISFERAPFDGSDTDYINPHSPSNYSCHVFHKDGGRVSYVPLPDGANDGTEWTFVEAQVIGVGADQTACGSDCSDILLMLGGMRESTCEILNRRFTGEKTIAIQGDGGDYEDYKFAGEFSDGPDIDGLAESQLSMCIQDASSRSYFYTVLQPR
ncbi:MAG: hypothetical protein GC137_01105 [Alphaproteobacteria bacterium]|nr:hypothetical protein [Alphaproteobacteria bacterium]